MSAPYIKLVVNALFDAKLLAASGDAFKVYVNGLLYAKAQMTDGFVPAVALPAISLSVPNAAASASELVMIGLWQETEGGWTVGRDKWAKHQMTKEDVEKKRDQDRARLEKFREARACNANETRFNVTDETQMKRVSHDTVQRVCNATREQRTENREQRTENREQEALEALDNSAGNGPAKSAGQRAQEPKASDAAKALASQFLEARSRNNGPKPTAASVATFATRVFDPLLSEYQAGEVAEVMRYLDKPANRWWQFVSGNPRGYEHPLKRNLPAILAEARNGGRKDPNAPPPKVDMALAAWQDDTEEETTDAYPLPKRVDPGLESWRNDPRNPDRVDPALADWAEGEQ